MLEAPSVLADEALLRTSAILGQYFWGRGWLEGCVTVKSFFPFTVTNAEAPACMEESVGAAVTSLGGLDTEAP